MTGNPKLPLPTLTRVWRQVKDFSGYGGDATYLWPRWIFLRAVGLVYLLIFSGIIDDSRALIGPRGILPLPGLIDSLRQSYPGAAEAFLRAPSLFWLNSSPAMVLAVEWCGLAAAVALLLNLWPRLSLAVCWVALLSFATVWKVFSGPLLDGLMLEVALLCIPFAPAGFRPGLGAKSPPWPIAVLMIRWLVFRVMFESGVVKVLIGDPRWLNFTAMDDFYETAPCPTYFGYLFHQLPHAWHVGEILLTYVAEFAAPLAAVFLGRRGRWFAFWPWVLFQAGIQLTCNFGWLNLASIGVGVLLFDDQMLAAAARRLRLGRLAQFLPATAVAPPPAAAPAWRVWSLHTALWTHFSLTLISFAAICDLPLGPVLEKVAAPLRYVFGDFRSANSYTLYSWLDPFHCVVEFEGSNDGGQTWRSYDFRYYPNRVDRIGPHIAPRFPRFEASLQIELNNREAPSPLYPAVAAQLLARNPLVTGLFERNPFPEKPPQMIRLPGYRLTFTDLATRRETGRFWNRKFLDYLLPMIYVDASGQIVQAGSILEEERVKAECGNAAAQSHLGYMFISGEGVERDAAEAVKWYRRAAEQGLADAQLNLGLIYAHGDGVPANTAEAAKWFRRAALQGLAEAQGRLAQLCYAGDGVRQDATEALAWLTLAANAGDADAVKNRDMLAGQLGPTRAFAAEQRARALRSEIKPETPAGP
jgi:TPR repeat protein